MVEGLLESIGRPLSPLQSREQSIQKSAVIFIGMTLSTAFIVERFLEKHQIVQQNFW